MKNFRFKSSLVIISILLSAGAIFAKAPNLDEGKWTLQAAFGRPTRNTTAFIEFNNGMTSFSGNTSCNIISGSVDVRGSRIHFSNFKTTKRFCMRGSIEGVFMQGLENAVRYSQRGKQLRLIDRRGRTVLQFRLTPDRGDGGSSSTRLEDRKWFLESIKNRRTLVAINGVFINFDAGRKSAGGDTGCNVFGGNYTASGSTIRITGIISTMRACEEDGRMQTEREFLDGLKAANRFEIRDERLMLYRDRELLLTFRGEAK